jgi:type IV secretory pathway VirB10-like protein
MVTQNNAAAGDRSPDIQDHRQTPHGVLPRRLQMWLMIGIALVILGVIFVTGHSAPAPRLQSVDRPASAALPPTDRIRGYQQQLAQEVERQQHVLAQESAQARASGLTPNGEAAQPDPLVEEQRRRNYQSLFADSVALSRRPSGQQAYGEAGPRQSGQTTAAPSVPSPDALALFEQALTQAAALNGMRAAAAPNSVSVPTTTAGGTVSPSDTPEASTKPLEEHPASGPRLRLLEGTLIETVLLNRLDGTFSGPVNGLVTTPVYSQDRQTVLIPAGARVLGAAAPVQAWGDARLAVSFHRLLMPDGHTYSLDGFKGLDQIGETGLRDSVNRHYLQVFGASLAIGALSGLAQYHTRGGGLESSSFGDADRQAAGASLATSTARVLDRYLNVLPTITIREGFRMKVYLTNDLDLPAYSTTDLPGGAR